MWLNIQKNYVLFEKFTRFQVSCGKNISFWEDAWCGSEPLKDTFPDIYVISQKKNTSIHDCWDANNQTWNLGLRRGLFER